METRSIEKQVTIDAPDHNVWDVLVNTEKIAQWAAAFGKGIHAETDWAEGSEILWKDGNNEICATGIIAVFRRNVELHVDFYGKSNPQMQSPTGRSSETYSLKKTGEHTTVLEIEAGPLSDDDFDQMNDMWEQALDRIKQLAEG